MKIIKYCKKEYHIEETKNIQIGTLNYYRTHYEKKIQDSTEGKTNEYIINTKERGTLSKQDTHFITGGMLTITNTNAVPGITFGKNSTGSFQFNITWPNVFLFCCSYEKKGNMTTANSLGYDSFYEITDPEKFSKMISKKLKKYYENYPIKFKVQRWHQLVDYDDEKIVVIKPSEIIRGLFVKKAHSPDNYDIDFRLNKEYRFVWLMKNSKNNDKIGISENFVRLDPRDIKKMCRT